MKRHWGKSKVYYCPESKKVWQYNKDGYKIHYGMPSYGLERKVLKK
mgnify:CR=1|tara:strand:+ start:637 stop:774 length:138 start_codon:yes stop_codon:yes gene_type:complete